MRKIYMAPVASIVAATTQSFLAASGVSGGEGTGSDIGYGGVDDDGSKDPSSRRHRDIWDDDSDREETFGH